MPKPNYFKIAEKAAEKSDIKSIKVGACLHNGKAIYRGYNTKKTHPLLPDIYNSTLSQHAEFYSILHAGKDAQGSTLYVFRKSKTGKIKMARPCRGCLGFAISKGIEVIFYSIDENTMGTIWLWNPFAEYRIPYKWN